MKIKKIVYKQLYKLLRNKFIKEHITQLGKIVEEDNRIVCYVEQKRLDAYRKKNFSIDLGGFNTLIQRNKEIVDSFKLNKPVYYIFDNIYFNHSTRISGMFSNIEFRNCTFWGDISTNPYLRVDNVTFENNIYKAWSSPDSKVSFRIYANKLKLINENFKNSEEPLYLQYETFGMKINTDVLEIVNSNIDTGKTGSVDIKSEDVVINNSIIKTPEVIIDSKQISFENSKIEALRGIAIEGECNTINQLKVDTPTLILNNEEINGKDKVVNTVDESANLENSRLKLLHLLKQISLNCKNEIVKTLEEKEIELNNGKVKSIFNK